MWPRCLKFGKLPETGPGFEPLLPSGSPFGDMGLYGDLFPFLGPRRVPIFRHASVSSTYPCQSMCAQTAHVYFPKCIFSKFIYPFVNFGHFGNFYPFWHLALPTYPCQSVCEHVYFPKCIFQSVFFKVYFFKVYFFKVYFFKVYLSFWHFWTLWTLWALLALLAILAILAILVILALLVLLTILTLLTLLAL